MTRGLVIIWMKDVREMLFSWQASLWLVAGALLFSLTSYLILTNTGITLLTQSESLLSVTKIVILVGLMAAIIDASASLASEFESGTADGLLVSPITFSDLVLAKIGLALTVWAGLYVVSVPYLLTVAAGTGVILASLVYTAVVGTLALGSLVIPVVALSLLFKSVKSTLITSLVILVGFSLPAVFSSTLSVGGLGSVIKRLDPIQNAFAILDNVIVDTNTSPGSNLSDLGSLIFVFLFAGALLAVLLASLQRPGREAAVTS